MKDFNERKKKYLEDLIANPNALKMLVKDKKDTLDDIKATEIVLDPKNDFELDMDEIMLSLSKDMIALLDRIALDEVEEIPAESNAALNFYIKIINLLGNDANAEVKIPKVTDPKEAGKFLYHTIVGFVGDPENSAIYVAEKCGCDLEDEVDAALFNIKINKAKLICDKINNFPQKKLYDYKDEDVEFSRAMVEEFHKQCLEGKKDLSKETDSERLARALVNTLFRNR